MPDQITNKLSAFLDGELDQRGQMEVQAHLETCPACREELEALQRVSHLLHASPQPDFTPAASFRDRLMLQLPRRDEALPDAARSNSQLLPWMAPVTALGGWVFIQAVLNMSALVSFAGRAGFLGSAITWAAGNPQQTQWYAAAQALFGGVLSAQMPAGLKLLNDAGVFAGSLAVPLLWQLGAAALYWGALILVWYSREKALRLSSIGA